MKTLSLPELQAILLRDLIAFDTYCRKHDIRYSLCGGTLIGAVRHEGFIPWDDDTDVMMTRSEYNKLTDCWLEDPLPGYCLLTDRTANPFYAGESGKWYAEDTAPSQPQAENDIGIFMDIFIADGLPDQGAEEFFRATHRYGARYHTLRKRKGRPLWEVLRVIPLFNPQYWYQKMQHNLQQHPDTTATTLALILGSTKNFTRECIPKSYFDHFIELNFAGHSFPAIADYDAYLRHYYGDYMQLPPENERLSYHTKNHILKQ